MKVGALVRSSHENVDGSGYPDQLRGGAIPLGSRIISVCDAFDAMTTDRSYRRAMSDEQAIAELHRLRRHPIRSRRRREVLPSAQPSREPHHRRLGRR